MSAYFGPLNGIEVNMARSIAHNAASALISGLWQSTLLVAGTWLLLKLVPRTTAAARFSIWTAVFCVSTAMPLAAGFFAARTDVLAGQVRSGVHADPRWSYLIAGVWAAAVIFKLVGLALQGLKLRALWKQAMLISEEKLAETGCEELLATSKVRVCTSEDVDRPSVIGFLAPKILVPSWLMEQLSGVELRHLVLHEMEHLRRRDDWMNLGQKIALVFFPLNPALFWIDRRLSAERELACDDGVVRKTQMPRTYATCLASIAELRLQQHTKRRVVALALGVLGAAGILRGRPEFSRRIESILGGRSFAGRAVSGPVVALLVLGTQCAGLGLARAPQLVSFAPLTRTAALSTTPVARQDALPIRTPSSDGVSGVWAQNVSFHAPNLPAAYSLPAVYRPSGSFVKPKKIHASSNRAAAVPEVADSIRNEAAAQQGAEWMVLTSFEQDAPARVVVRMPDGRFYVVPVVYHAAVPVRDGWLIVQL